MAYASCYSYPPSAFSNTLNTSSLSFNLHPPFSNLLLPRRLISTSSALACSRSSFHSSPLAKKRNKANVTRNDGTEDDEDIDENAFEAMFSMLQEDLKNDDFPLGDNDDDISEEDLIKLQSELEESFGMADDDDDNSQVVGLDIGDANHSNDDEEIEEEEEEDEVERPVKLKNWQLRRLASALKKGRRKISIKNLAADICLDRAVVLQMLRDPPPYLVLMSATLPDDPKPTPLAQQSRPLIPPEERPTENVTPSAKEVKMPVHVMRHRWNAQKRLKKVHINTLEKVYRKTKRPTNTMISSIIQVTNLPRKRVVKWFEDKRNEDGIPEQRVPYQRSVSS